MFYQLLLIIITYFLSTQFQRQCYYFEDRESRYCGLVARGTNAKLLYAILVAYFVLFSGLRSFNNDTSNYIAHFLFRYKGTISELQGIKFSLDDGYLFQLLTLFTKIVFGNNYARFLTIIALITCGSYIKFFRKYSADFALAVFLMITSTFFNFSMAAVRQCLAIAVAIWAVPSFYNKKYTRGFIWLVLGIFIHKFVLLYVVAFFLRDNVWNKKTLLIIGATALASFGFSSFFGDIAEATGYAESSLVTSGGTNFLRTLVWLVPVFLSFLYRKVINTRFDGFGKMIINMSLIGSMIMVLASFGGANLIGRTAYFFYPFLILSFAEIITVAMNRKDSQLLRMLCMIGFFIYYVLLTQGNGGFFEDYYRHNRILDLFKSSLTEY